MEKILAIDDDLMSLKVTQTVLETTGYKVSAESSGALGIAALQCEQPDLVLLDIEMPGQGGMEIFRKIRSLDGMEDIPIIFLTGSGDIDNVVMAAELGAVDYLKKPFLPEELIKRVQKALDNQQK